MRLTSGASDAPCTASGSDRLAKRVNLGYIAPLRFAAKAARRASGAATRMAVT